MVVDIERVKAANPIEDVIGVEYPLRGTGRYLRAEAHDSMVVDTHGPVSYTHLTLPTSDLV